MAIEPRLSLAEQIAQLSDGAFLDNVAEQDQNMTFDGPPLDHYLEVGPSSLRQDDSLAGPKYHSARVTRDKLYEDDSEDDSEDDDDEIESAQEDGSAAEDSEQESMNQRMEHNDIPGPLSSRLNRAARDTPPRDDRASQVDDRDETHDLASSIRASRDKDRQKGKAVAHQLDIWGSLLDARIRLQKAFNAANQPSLIDSSSNPSGTEAVETSLREALHLSRELLALERDMFDLHNTAAEDVPMESSDDVTQLSRIASTREAAAHSDLLQTLSKWSTKIRAVTPLESRSSSFKSSFGKNAPEDDIQAITSAIQSSLEAATADTATNGRSQKVFSDTAFYQQLLRDVIASQDQNYKNLDSELSTWLPSTKKKRATVDTKASKGRKLRYEVHEKLQNFMVPIPVVKGGWHDQQIDDLFLSLAQFNGE